MDLKTPDPVMSTSFPPRQGKEPRVADISEDLEYQGSFVATAIRCRKLGWRLAAVEARELVDLAVNFAGPVEHWLGQCRQAGVLQGRVNLGVHTGSASGLVVLEVGNGEGKSALDHCGSWRSPCQARLHGREQHYYSLPPGVASPPTRFLMAARVMVFGEGGLAPLPPSVDVQAGESWRWLNPPWEFSPPELPPSLRSFLKQLSSLAPAIETPDEILSWEEVYRLITPHEPLLKALLAPYRSLEEHYGDLLNMALSAGLSDQKFLLGLLWHAPQGDVMENPARGIQLRQMAAEARVAAVTPPETQGVPGAAGTDPGNGALAIRSHYEKILGELKRLMQKAAELEALMQGWSPNILPGQAARSALAGFPLKEPGEPGAPSAGSLTRQTLLSIANETVLPGEQKLQPTSQPSPDDDCSDLWKNHYSALAPITQASPSLDTMEAAISDCLQNYPDLAEDPAKLQMVQYCFKNYVNIDPNLSDLSLPERWERASKMAREFLGGQDQP